MQTRPDPSFPIDAVVAIPVRDEAERIVDCLQALALQQDAVAATVLLVNNTTDATMAVLAELAPTLPFPLHAIEHHFTPELASAGQARRLAMQHADALAPPGVPLLTTDADGRVYPDWLARNLHHLRHGIDAVFGRAEIDPVEAARIPPVLHQADAEECAYAALLDQIASLIDPDPADPWPRHTEHSGASIAVRRRVFQDVGGIPAVPLGEDRAFHAALRRADARIRHDGEVRVVVSGRILGRAVGGMADTIRRRLVAPDTELDDALEPALDRVARLRRRRAARLDPATPLPFGQAWATLDALRPMRRVPVAQLPAEMALATRLRDDLLARQDELSVTV